MRKRIAALLATCALFVAGCGSDVINNLDPVKRDAAVEYLKDHHVAVPKGWRRGILVSSKAEAADCFNTCHTWHGTVVTGDGSTLSLSSEWKKGDAVFNFVPVGADFMWKNDTNFTSLKQVKLIKADPFATTSTSSQPPTT